MLIEEHEEGIFMPNHLDNQLCFLLYATSKEIIRHYTSLLKPYDLTYTGYITILALEENEQITVKELGQRLFLDSGTLTPLLKKLEAKGYICRERSKDDERQMQIYLTEEGNKVRRKLPEVSRQVMKQSNISEQQFIQLKNVLQDIIHNDWALKDKN
ncbi:MarR family transcriptional regulator [Lysinibacillus sphaericus]|uniref:MarR family winged helix-turn-helix transcriptional regulator n=1 Tax=Lysinibacillus sphaericus TaxID=1421 RepID=UPI0015D48ED2|nr:MarR family transcriptional regulator [Lysinibacillus sphaericus]MBI6865698.1 MarR family transcriptional regulator [Lysinibacillus fusiformis]QPA52802.1 MarR family transcriptional regulator [Lysinibacillus sphaericus]QTB11864.1 MarR family transcriptional regulator [Lysinibacillus sphaericus]QTB20782.1 MarR family transcriptional regulator [Lysinibacillus sphaericus]QTB25307.1 MarR family transcriptional regulator [Lysinibacillus sphaericus]